MESGAVLSPTTRLSDDLYALYLAALGWLLLPIYGTIAAEALPSQWSGFDSALSAIVAASGGIAFWTGARGGPLMVTRAAMIHELGSPADRRRLLLPRLVRQAVGWGMGAAIVATVLLVLADSEAFGFGAAFRVSVVSSLAAVGAMFQATSWLVVLRGPCRCRLARRAAAAVAPLVLIGYALLGGGFVSGAGAAVLLSVTLWSLAVGVYLIDDAPVETLWSRALAFESLRSAVQTADFRRVVLDLRNVADQPAVGRSASLGLGWLPTQIWRYLAAVRHVAVPHVARLAVSLVLVGVLLSSDVDQGIVILGVAGSLALLGLELTGPLASTADHLTLAMHYRRGSVTVLGSQVALTLVLAALLASGAAVMAVALGGLDSDGRLLTGLALLALAGGLSATIQARLGSPNLVELLDRYGPDLLGLVLWLRALAGPLLLLAATVVVFHRFVRPEYLVGLDADWSLMPWDPVIGVLMLGAILVSIKPLEQSIR